MGMAACWCLHRMRPLTSVIEGVVGRIGMHVRGQVLGRFAQGAQRPSVGCCPLRASSPIPVDPSQMRSYHLPLSFPQRVRPDSCHVRRPRRQWQPGRALCAAPAPISTSLLPFQPESPAPWLRHVPTGPAARAIIHRGAVPLAEQHRCWRQPAPPLPRGQRRHAGRQEAQLASGPVALERAGVCAAQ